MNQLSHQNTFSLSKHAVTRIAQRGILDRSLDILLIHGSRSDAGGGCEKYCLLERTVKQLKTEGYDARALKSATKLRAIVSTDGAVVTCYRGNPERRKSFGRKQVRHNVDSWCRAQRSQVYDLFKN
jgi:hypothetical protein